MKNIAIVMLLSVMTAGCSSWDTPPEPEQPKPLAMPVTPLVQHIVFFDFDKDVLPDDIDALLAPHITYLIQHPTQRLLIEGAADETGDFTYNMTLGQRRANAVKKKLLEAGVREAQLISRSIGTQRPLNTEQKPHSLPRNRRVTLVY